MVFRVVQYQILVICREPPTFDLSTLGPECLVADAELSTVHANRIAPPKIRPKARTGDRLIRTQPAVASFEVSVPVALDLLEVRVPVYTWSNPAKVRDLTAEVDNRPKITDVIAAIAGAARVVIVAEAVTTIAIVAAMGVTILEGMTTGAGIRSRLRCGF